MKIKLKITFLVMFLFIFGLMNTVNSINLLAAETSSSSSTSVSSLSSSMEKLFQQAKEYVDQKKYKKALPLLKKANGKSKNNERILNLLAYTQRNLGKIDLAIENYHKALKINPRFAEAREYLGEAYLQAALRELKILKSYGVKAQEEYQELKEEIGNISKKIN